MVKKIYLAMQSGHTNDVSGVTLELTGGFVPSFISCSTESWHLQQWEQTKKEDPRLEFEITEDINVLNTDVFFNKVKYNWQWEERRGESKEKEIF